ncbi:hypothetical protein GCM10009557_03560 [Virgisporangium ochraceum]|uniref:Uncharacterized protein n=2 Tax=Virgisporangium ochraceum TaxID=65505 RepID=A0A8J4EDF4_9ACTN|nr:hypothetical protein Voc01_055610 [Virgisporangium ochraceum]
MMKLGRPPVPVMVASVLSGLFATFLILAGVFAVSQGGVPTALVIGAVLAAVTWAMWTGRRSGRLSAILVGVFLIGVGVFVSESLAMRVLNVGIGLALVALLVLPASVRAYYGDRHRAVTS